MTRTGMAILGVTAVALAGCVGTDRATLERSGGGAAIGAATGAVVGAFSGSPGTGAAIGATLGRPPVPQRYDGDDEHLRMGEDTHTRRDVASREPGALRGMAAKV